MPDCREVGPEAPRQAGASRRMNASFTVCGAQRAPTMSQTARFSAGRCRMYSGNRSILTRVGVPSGSDHRPCCGRTCGGIDVIAAWRRASRVDIIGKDAIEFEMIERRLAGAARRRPRRPRTGCRPLDGAAPLHSAAGRSTGPCASLSLVGSKRRTIVQWFSAGQALYRQRLQRRRGRHSGPAARAPPRCAAAGCTWPVRSERASEPVLICPQLVATARSAMVASSVSPERCDMTAV